MIRARPSRGERVDSLPNPAAARKGENEKNFKGGGYA